MTRALLLAVLLAAPAALAWESACAKFPNPSLEPQTLKGSTSEPCVPSAGPAVATRRPV